MTDSTQVSQRALPQSAQASEQDAAATSATNPKEKQAFKPLGVVLGVEAWKRQGRILKHRASFPLLRQVLRSEIKQAKNRIQLNEISSDVLQRSLLAHIFILTFTVPATIWAAYSMTKGLAAGIRFDVWFNGWLLQGVPVFIFCAMKALTSNHSRKLIRNELAQRAAAGAVEK
ncbi:hypothetical protein [Stutzerimonas stutzeri]|uniref:hypothetical protein n=1 Tax=Stutzerimonas stutzeri TaxID=316 RepID=UPI0015E2C1DC|nr:hypothetical protein [Stutzerimonas stutzeri]MBA1280239.1 hypothetical protein [Stutzerimonas stutzeri]